MKRYIILTISLILLTNSCTEEVLEIENKGSLTADNWYKTVDDFEAAINSAYIPFMERGMFALMMNFTVSTFEDRILFETTGRDRFNTLNSSSSDAQDIWQALYHGVYRTSKLLQQLNIKGIDGIEGITEEQFNYLAAQAKAIRGMSYFYLVIFFDRPILYDENSLPDDLMKNYPNAEREALWNQIESDFKEAIPHLKSRSELADEEYGRVTKGAAQAQLAKSLLYKHYYFYERFNNGGSSADIADLEEASKYFRELMNSNEYELMQPLSPKTEKDYLYALLCNSSFVDLNSENNFYKAENNKESLWEVQFHDDKAFENNEWFSGHFSGGAMNVLWFSPHNASFKNWEVHPYLYYEFDSVGAPAPFDRDPRCKASIYFDGDTMGVNPNSPYYKKFNSIISTKRVASRRQIDVPVGTALGVKKGFFPLYWDGLQAPANDPVNKRVIRYADVLLMYAEVMLILGDDGSGLDALNQVRQRVDMPDVPLLSRDAIMHERDIELAFEGHRWFDLIRWSFSPEWAIEWNEIHWGINAENSIIPFVKGKHEFFPIPVTEIDVHQGQLKQNPGW